MFVQSFAEVQFRKSDTLPAFPWLLEKSPLGVSTSEIQIERVHEISNNVVCATSQASDQPAHMRSLIRAFASRLSIL